MTKSKRGRYTLEFKQEAVRLVESGQSQAAVARSLGVVEQTLFNWVSDQRARLRIGPWLCWLSQNRCLYPHGLNSISNRLDSGIREFLIRGGWLFLFGRARLGCPGLSFHRRWFRRCGLRRGRLRLPFLAFHLSRRRYSGLRGVCRNGNGLRSFLRHRYCCYSRRPRNRKIGRRYRGNLTQLLFHTFQQQLRHVFHRDGVLLTPGRSAVQHALAEGTANGKHFVLSVSERLLRLAIAVVRDFLRPCLFFFPELRAAGSATE